MRKLKLQTQVTVEGYVGGPDGDLDWRTWNWDDKLKALALSCAMFVIPSCSAEKWQTPFAIVQIRVAAQSRVTAQSWGKP